jgi:hypothetical protein
MKRLLSRKRPQPDSFAGKTKPRAMVTMKIIRADGTIEDVPLATVEEVT